MKEINIARNIINLRKKNKVTQEQLANAVNVSPQAVSKWETASCQPDAMMLPLIADFFNVSIDYLYYGCEDASDDIYERITNRIASKAAGTEELYEDALKMSSSVQQGIMVSLDNSDRGKRGLPPMESNGLPLHLMDIHGFSVCYPKGFSAIVTRDFVNSVNGQTMKRAKRIFEAFANEDCLRVIIEILNFRGISYIELIKKVQMDEDRLKNAIEIGKNAGLIEERKSVHAVLGFEYFIQRHCINCLLLIFSAIKMIGISLRGATSLMRAPKFSMSVDEAEDNPSDEL